MNYLAHAYLSFNNPEILVGNMISDYVKGKQKEKYSAGIQQGIVLHRSLDHYTDNSTTLSVAKDLFRPKYRLYAGAIVDVILDHFLAKQLVQTNILTSFAAHTYKQLAVYQNNFPEKFALMYPNMVAQNWLVNYQYDWGIAKSLTGLMRRAKYIDEVETAFGIYEDEYEKIAACCKKFWELAIPFAQHTYKSVTNDEAIPYK